jgi:acetylornithine deacetylase/succinyl-diaminopimelate desuccinylase-like protein
MRTVAITNSSQTMPQPAELLQRLIRFDTTNPPGNEGGCVGYIRTLLDETGIETTILAADPDRPCLIARLPGQGRAAPLLLYGHVDVVTAEDQAWNHPPFGGELIDGYVWGRGTLDMKGGIAMMVSAVLRAKAEGCVPPGDVILVILPDEEAGGDLGARFLVEEHPEQFAGIRYALGEFGGFTLHIGRRRFYPIQVAEKQICWLRAICRGPGGHGSMPVSDGAMARLGRFLIRVDGRKLPLHVTPVAERMFRALGAGLGGVNGRILGQLANPRLAPLVLSLLGKQGRLFEPLLRNTVSPTILHGSTKVNVIPCQVSVELDGRLLPGFGPDDMIAELQALAGDEVEFEVLRHDPGPPEPDMGLFDMLTGVLRDADPDGIPVPMVLSGVTDGRFFARLGIQTYGFTPMQLPTGFDFSRTIHGPDERIPVEAVEFGADAIFRALGCFGA